MASGSKGNRVLLVEDDARIRREILDALRAVGYEVQISVSCSDALAALGRDYDLVLLDLGLPDGDGLDICRSLRDSGRSVPIIILTARDAPEQRVRGLDVGADDYLVKPFHLPELLARIRSVLRRTGRSVGTGPIRCGALWADPEERTAGRGPHRLDLKPREFELLLFLMRHPGRAWTREQLLDRVWGSAFDGTPRTIDSHIGRLRSQVEEDASDPHVIETVWGVGYRLRDTGAGEVGSNEDG